MEKEFEKEQSQLIEHLKRRGIPEYILKAIEKVPRHKFIPKTQWEYAYYNEPVPIGYGQTISQPYTVAFMTQLLEIKPNDKVLEIGTGSGYQAAILAYLGAQVFTLERIKPLYDRTKKLFQKLGYENKIKIFYADGNEGLPAFAPFDKIIITAAAEHIPEPLKKQLKIGGILVAPVGTPGHYQNMLKIIKLDKETFKTENFGNFVFVPLKKGLE